MSEQSRVEQEARELRESQLDREEDRLIREVIKARGGDPDGVVGPDGVPATLLSFEEVEAKRKREEQERVEILTARLRQVLDGNPEILRVARTMEDLMTLFYYLKMRLSLYPEMDDNLVDALEYFVHRSVREHPEGFDIPSLLGSFLGSNWKTMGAFSGVKTDDNYGRIFRVRDYAIEDMTRGEKRRAKLNELLAKGEKLSLTLTVAIHSAVKGRALVPGDLVLVSGEAETRQRAFAVLHTEADSRKISCAIFSEMPGGEAWTRDKILRNWWAECAQVESTAESCFAEMSARRLILVPDVLEMIKDPSEIAVMRAFGRLYPAVAQCFSTVIIGVPLDTPHMGLPMVKVTDEGGELKWSVENALS